MTFPFHDWLSVRSPRERRVLRGGSLTFAVWLLVTLVVRPYVTDISHQREALLRQREALAREQQLLAEAGAFEPRFGEIEGAVMDRARSLFAGSDDALLLNSLADHIGRLAARRRVMLHDVDADAPIAVESGVATMRLQIRGVSDLRGLVSFIADVEGGSKLVSIEELLLTRIESDPATGQEGAVGIVATLAGYAFVDSAGSTASEGLEPATSP